MATVILKFDKIEEQEDIENAINGWKYKYVLQQLNQNLRDKLKYSELTKQQYQCYTEIKEMLLELVQDNNLNLD